MTSCYHEFPGGGGGSTGGGGGGTGNTILNVTLTSTPSSTVSFVKLNWSIGAINLINAAGQPTALTLSTSQVPELVRLQTDSLFLGQTTIPAGSYTNLQLQFNAPATSYFYNSTNATLLGCASRLVCSIPGTVAGFGASTVTVPITYTATANQSTGIRINLDLSKAVTIAGGMTFDFTQTGAVTIATLPPLSSQTSGLDTVDNFTGTVTAKTSTTITVSSAALGASTFTMSPTAEFDDPFNICGGQASFSCFVVNQNVSLDGVLNSDGTMTANEVEFLDPAPLVNELEGVVITPFVNNQFKMILTNGMGTAAAGALVSQSLTVTLNNAPSFFVDPKNLGIATTPLGFQSSADLVMGQKVMLQGGTNGNLTLTNPTQVVLRYSSMGGSVQLIGNPFTLSNVDPLFSNLLNDTTLVQTYLNTASDNISQLSSLQPGTVTSVRGLYLNPNSGATTPVLAAKVRTH